MGNPKREYVLFVKEDFWELWRCRGDKATFMGDAHKLNEEKKKIHSKSNICHIRQHLGFEKFYGDKKGVEEYLFLLEI